MSALVRLRLPHPFLLLLGGVVAAAALTWLLPAGEFDRRTDPETQTPIVVAGTYRAVDNSPVGPIGALIAVPQGFIDGADIIVLILFVGGAFVLLDQTGALRRLIGVLVDRVRHPTVVIATVCLLFSTHGTVSERHGSDACCWSAARDAFIRSCVVRTLDPIPRARRFDDDWSGTRGNDGGNVMRLSRRKAGD